MGMTKFVVVVAAATECWDHSRKLRLKSHRVGACSSEQVANTRVRVPLGQSPASSPTQSSAATTRATASASRATATSAAHKSSLWGQCVQIQYLFFVRWRCLTRWPRVCKGELWPLSSLSILLAMGLSAIFVSKRWWGFAKSWIAALIICSCPIWNTIAAFTATLADSGH